MMENNYYQPQRELSTAVANIQTAEQPSINKTPELQMHGHLAIRSYRLQHLKPAFIWITDVLNNSRVPTDFEVLVDRQDVLDRLDLRFVVGTTVLIRSDDSDRLSSLMEASKRARAARIIATLTYPLDSWHWGVAAVFDSEGVLTWQT